MDWWWILLVATRSVSPSQDDRWATVLTRLDEARSDAFAQSDAGTLDQVYIRGSGILRADRATLDGYRRRDARVEGAELRVLSCRVVSVSKRIVRLDVVDQLAQAQVVWSDGATSKLPHDEPTRRTITLERTSDGWRISGATATA